MAKHLFIKGLSTLRHYRHFGFSMRKSTTFLCAILFSVCCCVAASTVHEGTPKVESNNDKNTCTSAVDVPKVNTALQNQLLDELTKTTSKSSKPFTDIVYGLFSAGGWVTPVQLIIFPDSKTKAAIVRHFKPGEANYKVFSINAKQTATFINEFDKQTTQLTPLCRPIFDAPRFEIVRFERDSKDIWKLNFRLYMDDPSIEGQQPNNLKSYEQALNNFLSLVPKK